MGEEELVVCDSREILCLAPAFEWKDPFKERLFGLTNNQKPREDVKELYFHQVSTLTHYNKYLINILKRIFMMIWCQNHRSREETEFELLDTDSLKTMPILIVLSNMQKQVLMIF
jgi:hypothetical protein